MPLSHSAKFVRIEVDGGLQHHYIRANKWDHPAGRIEKGETPIQAAHRELIERTGHSAEKLEPLGVDGDFHVFRARKVTKVGHPQTEIRWKEFSAARSLFDKVTEIRFTTISATKNMIRELRKHGVHITSGTDRRLLLTDAKESVGRFDPDPISIAVTRGKGARGIFWHEAGHAMDEIKNHPSVELNKALEAAKAKDYFDNPFSEFHKLKRRNEITANHYAQEYMQRYNVPAKNIKQWRKEMAPRLNTYRAANFSAARSLFNKVIEFKSLYVPGDKDEPPETLPNLKGVVDYTVQRHAAKRAGLHRDVRIGTKRHGLLSWATRKDLPGEGGKIAIHPQPVHAHSYLGWEGDIPAGQYGAGSVSTEKLGKALVTRSTQTEVHATLADQKEHHRLALVRTAKGWLMTRGKHPQPPPEASKPSYKSVEPDKAHETLGSLPEGTVVQPKVDGALVYVTTKGNRPEVFSHRKGKQSGKHIIHTERFFHGRPTTQIPKEHQRTLIGELYGTRKGKAIEPQELGGILNTHLGESIQKQNTRGVRLKIMPFDYANGKGESYPERLAKVKETIKHLPGHLFHPPEEAHTPGAARRLFDKIRHGRHPLTKEGVIIHPPEGKMIKIKNTSEANVTITGTYPGTGKFEGSHGGFTYKGGRVGTGFTDETRRRLHEYIGRVARIKHQGRYDSGAHRAPSFIGVDENK